MKRTLIIMIALVGLFMLIGCSEESSLDESEPQVCTADYTPVCGVDGETYSNACMAGDVEIGYEGECIPPHVCSAEEKESAVCTKDYRPVCGNDGETYSNGCVACSSGIDSYEVGEC